MTRVHVIGAGLLGASTGLALRRAGHEVTLADTSPTAAALARDLGAGELADATSAVPEVVVVATPPDVTPDVVVRALGQWPQAVVTDVASVKGAVLRAVRAGLADSGAEDQLARYVGSHPMAGRERSGAIAARADLFDGRAWVVSPHPASDPAAVGAVRSLAADTGAAVVEMGPDEHDAAVAVVSHVPQVASTLVAGRLASVAPEALGLAGQGVRDVTRIAASDPVLWTQILAGNAPAVAGVLESLRDDLDRVIAALRALETAGPAPSSAAAPGTRAVLAGVLEAGNVGRALVPGKHGAPPTPYALVEVIVPDEPGALARLLTDVGDAGVNLEELRIDHGLGQPFGLAEVAVLPAAAAASNDWGWPCPSVSIPAEASCGHC